MKDILGHFECNNVMYWVISLPINQHSRRTTNNDSYILCGFVNNKITHTSTLIKFPH